MRLPFQPFEQFIHIGARNETAAAGFAHGVSKTVSLDATPAGSYGIRDALRGDALPFRGARAIIGHKLNPG